MNKEDYDIIKDLAEEEIQKLISKMIKDAEETKTELSSMDYFLRIMKFTNDLRDIQIALSTAVMDIRADSIREKLNSLREK